MIWHFSIAGWGMTIDLQIALAVVGVVVVFAIYLISRRQQKTRQGERHAAPSMHGHEHGHAHGDIDDAHPPTHEELPGIDADHDAHDAHHIGDADVAPPMQSFDDAATPASQSPPSDNAVGAFRNRPAEGFAQLSQIDYWVKITGERDVGRETVLAIYRDGAAAFDKAHGIYGVKTAQKNWCNVELETEDSRFTDLVVTIQLADRNGAISEMEMTKFSELVSRLSEGTGREFVFMAPVENAFAQADAILDFIRHFDSVFTLTVRPTESERFHGATIERYATQMGLERDANCRYTKFVETDDGKVALYSLTDLIDNGRFDFDNMHSFSTRQLTFFTRPAINQAPGAVFVEMAEAAKLFAARIKGKVSSPLHDDLSDGAIESTRGVIEQLAMEMEKLGIAAGSGEARRLF